MESRLTAFVSEGRQSPGNLVSIQETDSARDVNNTKLEFGFSKEVYVTSMSMESEKSTGERTSILELLNKQIETNDQAANFNLKVSDELRNQLRALRRSGEELN